MGITDQLRNVVPSIDMDKKIRELMSKLAIELPDSCFQCVKCTSGCTAFRLLEIKPHEFVNLVRMGFVEDQMKSELIWTCAQCLKCKERCPQKVPPIDLVFILRRMAVGAGSEIPEELSKIVMSVTDTGFIQGPQKFKVGEEVFDREKLGLGPLSLPNLERFKSTLMKSLEKEI